MSILMQSPVGARTVLNGREVDYFAGTGYLGLQSRPEVIQAAMEAIQRYGLFTATSRAGFGEHPIYLELEREACALLGVEKVLYFASGYLGMTVLTQGTAGQYDHIFIDSSAHYSLWDAAQATNLPITPFHHRDPESLAEHLRRELGAHERPLVMSDGIFPISGEIAPLAEYHALAAACDGRVYVDDAHALGVLGEHGRGTAEHFGLEDAACRNCGTLAKALGGYGGILFGEKDWVENIEKNSRACAGASPPPLPVAAAAARALALARAEPALRQKLRDNVKKVRDGMRGLGWEVEDTPSPVVCLAARDGVDLERIRSGLLEKGIAVPLVRGYSSTPPGGALRIAVFAAHSQDQIERLIGEMERLV
jgi:glycine C-acetyltransferase/8-amino-7-oxononanoate synthase